MDRDFGGANWAQNHQHLSDGISALFHKLAYGFRRLQAIQYDAPWRHKSC